MKNNPDSSKPLSNPVLSVFSKSYGYFSSLISKKGRSVRALTLIGAVSGLLALGLCLNAERIASARSDAPLSALCHVTDGTFTTCPGGATEWSDVPQKFFPETNSYLYADQTDLDPTLNTPNSTVDTLVLMYDEVNRTTPLGPDEYFLINFKTVEIEDGKEKLENYVIHVFTDGTIIFFENGVVQPPGRAPLVEGQRGRAGFGPSPNSATPHLIAEFEIKLSAANVILDGAYSPDPIFWGSAPPPTPTPPPCPAGDSTVIPITISLLKNAGISKADAITAVNEANKVLSKANKNLKVKLQNAGTQTNVTDGDDGSGGGTAGDGDLTMDELFKVLDASDKKVTAANKKGINITFARTPIVGDSSPGVSRHTLNSLVVTKRSTDSLAQTGIIIAHEIGHILTVRDHSTDPTNLMDPVEPPGGNTNLDDSQAKEICTNGLPSHGKTVSKKSPGQKRQQQYGVTIDDINDIAVTSPRYFDLYGLSMSSETTDPIVNAILALNGSFPSSGAVDASYRLLFDADSNTLTGKTIAGFSGIDTELRIRVKRDTSPGPLSVSGVIVDNNAGGAETSLPSTPEVVQEPLLDVTSVTNIHDHVVLSIPKSLLKLTATDVPSGVISQDSVATVQDSMSLVFDQNHFENDPTLTLTHERANVGASVPFTIAGLEPNGSFTLVLGDDQVFSGALDSAGGFSGSFVVPSLTPGDYFLIAQDSSDAFGFNAIEITPPLPTSPNMINNGIVQLGINNQGHLNVPGGLPSSGSGTTIVGLRFLPTGAEATAPGCLCEGWGVADSISGVRGFANVSTDGVRNITLLDYSSTATTAVSKVQIGSTFRVTHDYHPSFSPNLYEAKVTIENISNSNVDVRYRRVMDWDIEPTPFSEFVTLVTIQGSTKAANVLFSSDNGFASADPLSGPSSILFSGDAQDSGPADHGALFDFGFGNVAPGNTVSFNIYYGAAPTEAEALTALATIRAEVFSFGQPNTPEGPTLGKPNTFMFAFANVGGGPIIPLDTDGDDVLDEVDNCPRTPNPDQLDSNLNGLGNACELPDSRFATAAFLQALIDGTTVIEPTSTLVSNTPSLIEQLRRIVQFRIDAGLTNSPQTSLTNLIDSLVDAHLVPPDQANALATAVLQLVVLPVTIDIKPDGVPNSINPDNGGNIPVAILSTPTLNAPGMINRASLTFGRTGSEQSLLRTSIEDVNKDGQPDILCHFDTRRSAFRIGDTQGILRGRRLDGVSIIGTDTVRIVAPR
jgi:hypothetical protein